MTTQKIVWQKTRHALAFASLTAVALLSPLSAFAGNTDNSDIQNPDPGIHMEKSASPSELPAGGGSVLYNFFVFNDGNVPLSDISVTDDKCSPVVFLNGDTDSDGKLDTNETWHYSCSQNLTETTTNTATAKGRHGQKWVSHTEEVTVKVGELPPPPPPPQEELGIKVKKSADPATLGVEGGSVTYTYVVTNTGNTSLHNISISDDKCSPISFAGGDTNADSILDVGEFWKYKCTMNLKETTINTVFVKSIQPNDKVVTDTDKVTVTVPAADPGIKVVKSADPTSLPANGGSVTYTYMVSNQGNVPLYDTTITDDKCTDMKFAGGDTDHDSILDVGETFKYTCMMTLTQSTTNIVKVQAKNQGKIVYGEDTLTVKVDDLPSPKPLYQIKVAKTATPTTLPAAGGTVVYNYSVSNGGTAPLNNIVVSDDKCAPVTYQSGDANANSQLDINEIWKYVCYQTLTQTTTNTVKALSTNKKATIWDTAQATVKVGELPPPPPPGPTPNPVIHIVKTGSVSSLPAGGGSVTYTYWVNNNGNVPLTNVSVSDDKCSSPAYQSGDMNSDAKLDTNEVWKFTCTQNISATTTNTAIAHGTSDNQNVTSSASLTVFVNETPVQDIRMNLEKSASVTSLPIGGGSVTYSYFLTAPGNTALTNISIADDKCSPVTYQSGDVNGDNKVNPGEVWKYTCTQNITTTTTNIAIARSVTNGFILIDGAQATVNVATVQNPPPPPPPANTPAIHLEKMASPSSLAVGGGPVTYHFAVTNRGNVLLSNIIVTDNKCAPVNYISGDANGNGWLDFNETWKFQCNANISESVTNIGAVRGIGAGVEVRDTDTATVIVNVATVQNPPPPPPPATGGVTGLPATGEGGDSANNGLGMTVSALIAMAAFLGIVGISLFSQEQEKKLKR